MGRVIAHFVEIENGQDVGHSQPLADIPLPLPSHHVEHMPPQLLGFPSQTSHGPRLALVGLRRSHNSVFVQSARNIQSFRHYVRRSLRREPDSRLGSFRTVRPPTHWNPRRPLRSELVEVAGTIEL